MESLENLMIKHGHVRYQGKIFDVFFSGYFKFNLQNEKYFLNMLYCNSPHLSSIYKK